MATALTVAMEDMTATAATTTEYIRRHGCRGRQRVNPGGPWPVDFHTTPLN